MSQKIEIPVEATLDPKPAEAAAKRLGKTLDAVGRKPIELVPDSEVKKLKEVDLLWRRYLALDKKLAAGVRNTAQAGLPFSQVDLAKAGANPIKISRINEFVRGGLLPKASSVLADAAGQAAGAAVPRATGAHPVAPGGGGGGIPAARGGAAPSGNAPGAPSAPGMSAGFGAGLMGLVGGIAALGVSKLVGAVTENIEKAENNNIAYDKLKRTLGDVNVSFNTLKSVITQTGDGLKLTYGDAAQLAAQYVTAGGLKDGDFRALPEELGLGVGMSRAYGLDPSQGVGVLGQMRGVGATRDTSEARRMAMLIGETIAKSDAFSKADEVMEAIANFTVSQTRQSFSAANTQAYAGMLAGAVSSGTPGLDPTGAAGLLAKVNASLAAGGGKGEASQFFTSQLGAARGMNVFQTQLWREGGAFATADSVFGGDSAVAEYYRRNALEGPKGSETLMSATLDRIRKKYSDPEMRLNAAAGHMTGGNMSAAAALLNIEPEKMGELEKYLGANGLKGVNASGIGNAARAVSGTADDRRAIADKLLSRNDVSEGDKDRIKAAMASGSEEKQKEVLAQLSAQYEQERTTGKDISDMRVIMDNIKTTLSDSVATKLNDVKTALVHMAGGGKKTFAQIRAEVNKAEAKGAYEEEMQTIGNEREALTKRTREVQGKSRRGEINDFEYGKEMRDIKAKRDALDNRAMGAKATYDGRVKDVDNPSRYGPPVPSDAPSSVASGAGKQSSDPGKPTGTAPGAATPSPATSPTGAPAIQSSTGSGTSDIDAMEAEAERRYGLLPATLKALRHQETGGKQKYLDDPGTYHYPLNAEGRRVAGHTGKVSTAFGPYGILESTAARPGYNVKPMQDKSLKENVRFAAEYLAGRAKSAGSLEAGLAGYGEGWGYSNSVMRRAAKFREAGIYKTPIPETKSTQAPGNGSGTGLRREDLESLLHISLDDLQVNVSHAPGLKVKADDTIKTRIDAPHASSDQRFNIKP